MAITDIWSEFRAGMQTDRAAAWRLGCLEALRQSGLFDAAFYTARHATPPGIDPLEHYHDTGWRAGFWPNPYFDPAWYIAEHEDVAAARSDPLLHYVSYGEQEGRRPVLWFDPAWYRAAHRVGDAEHALRHFLLRRHDGTASPVAAFDSAWYLRTYPDVAAAGMDPMEHYLVQGHREGRDPSPAFDSRFYRQCHLRHRPDENPLLHYLARPDRASIPLRRPAGQTTVAREIRRVTQRSPAFEPLRALPSAARPRATVLAYYLTAYHPIPQNDAWWGDGFTEWANVARGTPRFAGHYQPRIPRDLGHYSLDDPTILPRQVALARGAGLGGFIFHFYWFDRTRLLAAPLERFLADRSLDFPFCLMWANENWTRRWDGSDDDVLIAQHYDPDDEPALIAEFARHFADPRYLRLQGRPLLLIYRPRLIPDARATIAAWRRRFRATHGEDPVLVMAQSFGDADPGEFGLDAATEFPPHRLVENLPRLDPLLDLMDTDCTAQVYAYDDLVESACATPRPSYPLIRAAVPGWDNDARRQGRGLVVHGATPARYEAWLAHLVEDAAAHPLLGTPLVCINAWNEWSEAAYLEPDRHFGAAFLNATGRAIAGAAADASNRLLLLGHDAYPAGAQLLLLHLARQLRAAHGLKLEIVLLAGGALADAYRDAAPTTIAADPAALQSCLGRLSRDGFRHAIVNSAASAPACPALHAQDIGFILLIHEMPRLLAQYGLAEPLAAAAARATSVVFAADFVRDAVAGLIAAPFRATILPQGIYRPIAPDPIAGAMLRRRLGLADHHRLAVAIGHADLRKGFDLFLQVWRLAPATLHLAWAGTLNDSLRDWLGPEIAAAEASGRFHLLGWQEHLGPLLNAADHLLLTSREDPYPSVVLEALSAGRNVIAFDDSGGIPALLRETSAGQVVPMADCAAMAALAAAAPPRPPDNAGLLHRHRFDRYAAALLRECRPGLARVSVIVSCYNQAAMLPRRLAGIFAQSFPIHDIVLRDDASTDASPATAARIAADAGRTLSIILAAHNSGSPFAAWRAAVAAAEGDLVWIAEADDNAEPGFLSRLAQAMAPPDMLFAVCDSRQIDALGNPTPGRYADSYAAVGGPGALTRDEVFDAAAFAARFLAERNILFNISAILWRRAPLLAALDRLGADLKTWRIAGDWRLYLELLTTTPGRIAYIAEPLNHHCRHSGSVSAGLAPGRHLAEIARMHEVARTRLDAGPRLAARQKAYLAEAANALKAR